MMLRRHREAREAPEGEGPGTEDTAPPNKDDAPPKSAGRSSARSRAKKEG